MMSLHKDKDAFEVLLLEIHEKTGYRLDVLEKDYYVTLILEELSKKQQNGLPAYFKGGTALYKALRSTRRFSEDIDISVVTKGCSRTRAAKILDQATKEYVSVDRDVEGGFSHRSEVVAIYKYSPLMEHDHSDVLQRFGQIKVEATSFTIAEPHAPIRLASLIYDCASDEQKQILTKNYEVKPIEVNTLTIERIFIDKLFAAEAYTRSADIEHRAFDAAKHIYDLCVLSNSTKISNFLNNKSEFSDILSIRLEEEKSRLDGIPGIPIEDFTFFFNAMETAPILKAYETMQNVYVFKPDDKISPDVAADILRSLASSLPIHLRRDTSA